MFLLLPEYCFFFFSIFKKKLNFQFFCLSDRFLSSSRKLVTATVFLPKMFSPAAGWLIYELHLGILFSLKKTVSKTLLSSVFQTAFWVKKEFPNVTRKVISPPQAKKMFSKNMVAETSFRDEERKRSLTQENWLFIYKKKNGKIIVLVTVNSVAPLQKNMSQWQTFGEMKLKIKKTKKKKQYSQNVVLHPIYDFFVFFSKSLIF